MTYRILLEHVEGGWVDDVFDEDKRQLATAEHQSRAVAIERAKNETRNMVCDHAPLFNIQELSE